jgi:multidrug efflux pump subunit AcrB
MGTFAAMYFLGFTTNNLTLLALVLAIGVLVDDAIVMLENIHRHIEAGEPRMEAAFAGSREIGFAVLTASITICAVFIPVAFTTGIVGRFFFEFGITVAIAVGLSTLVALTLTPMMCSRFLRAGTHEGGVWERLERGYEALARRYRTDLSRILRFRGLALLAALAIFVGGMLLLGGVGSELLPDSDRAVFVILFDGPVGSTLGFADRYVRQVEEILGSTPELESYFTALALARGEGPGEVNRGLAFVRMVPQSERDRSQLEVMAELRRKLAAIPGLISFPVSLSAIPTSGGFQAPVQLVLLADDFEQLAESSRRFTDRISRIPGVMDVDTDLELDKPELRVRIDRDKAADLGVSVGTIASTLQVLLGGQEVTTYKSGGEQYDVIVQLHARDRMVPRDMDRIHVRTGSGALVPLSSFVEVGVGVGPSSLNHVDKERAVTVTANLEGLDLKQALERIDAVAAEVLPGGVRTVRAGQAEDFEESARSLLLTFVLSVAFIYMVLASQFNSFVHPFTIMLSLPLGLVGAFASLFAFGMTLNIYSAIGIILLMGIVTKNAILLVDYTNTLRSRGMDRMDAVLQAAQVRLRPILMTAVSTGFGVLPIALGWGAGAESRRPMGVAVLGGMITSTLLTLIVVPIVYTYLDDLQGWIRGGARKPAAEPDPAGA